jgi:hypothetical protein
MIKKQIIDTCAMAGTIKKNIQTTTIYENKCIVWVLTVSKYTDIQLNTALTQDFKEIFNADD